MTLSEARTETVLDYLAAQRPLGLPATISLHGNGPFIPVGLDNGNGQTKTALLNPQGVLVTRTTPTTYQTAREIRGGSRVTSYRVDGGAAFWIGDDAILEGDALPIGSTAERLGDRRQREFLAAVLVEALMSAGYQPGIHNLVLGLAIPNHEIVLKDNGNRLGVSSDTRQALKDHLQLKTFEVERTDIQGNIGKWTIACSHILPQAQSIGSYIAWSRQPNGEDAGGNIEALTIIDVGTGDLQQTNVDVDPYRMTGQRLGPGTILLARALGTKLQMGLNDTQAMQALIRSSIVESGVRHSIKDVVQGVIESEGHELVSRLLPVFQQKTRYVLFTGGGILLDGLRAAIEERAAAAGKSMPRNYTFVPQSHALTLNATGAMLAVIYAAAGKGA